jgi:CubicO group peptidase (beta-lactamase class C family)
MRHAFLLMLALFLPMARGAEADQPQNLEQLRQQIEAVMKETGTPAFGIALVNRDGPYWVAGWGMADRKSKRAANEDTLFRIGSISKMFAALAILKLEEEGRLSLDDRVRDRAPEIQFENPWEESNPVRIAHLLEHTTGWDDLHLVEYAYPAPDSMTTKQGLDVHPHSRISRWVPGTRHAYCNAGAAVAAYIVEKVTGQRYEDYVAATFLTPLDMTSTSYFKTPMYDERGATLYQAFQPQEYWQIIHRAAGSINSSARDMAHLVHFMLLRGSTPTAQIVSPTSIDRMEVSKTTLGSAAGVIGGYGLANYTSGHKALNVAFRGHNGGVIGGLSELAYVSELGEGYVVMINDGNGETLGRVSGLVRDYLLRNTKQAELVNADLPAAFRELDGYYLPINPRQQMMRYIGNLVAIMKITHDEKFLHRAPLFGSWVSNDRLGGNGALIDAWHGLPAIAIVEDPLAGAALQVNGELMKRVPAWLVFTRFTVGGLMIVMTLIGFVAFLVWCKRRFGKKRTSTDGRLWLRISPLLATALLFTFQFAFGVSGAFMNQAASISPLSVFVFLLSLAYPAIALFGIVQLLAPKVRERKNLPYWFAAVFACVHLLIAGYLTTYGVVGLRTWA